MSAWRPMRTADVGRAAGLANSVHLSYPEDPAVIVDRLAIYPSGCFVLDDGGTLKGYMVSHPWVRDILPPGYPLTSIDQLDAMRGEIDELIGHGDGDHWLTVVFTGDASWT